MAGSSSAIITIMTEAARKAGRSLTRDFGELENLQVSRKGPADFVSSADHRAEKNIRQILQEARPTYGLLMEESGERPGTDGQHRWIVDPLDGTTNFLHGLPLFCVSIALERGKEIVAGVIYNPVTDELFSAEKGNGCFYNDRRARVANRTEIANSIFVTGLPHQGSTHAQRAMNETALMSHISSGVRSLGSAALSLAYVAAGRFDGYYEHALQPWDTAAGLLLVREAGGFVSDDKGGKNIFASGSIIAGNESMHGQLIKTLKS